MTDSSRLARLALARTLDEEQARDRAEVHSLASAYAWTVIRTPQGLHIILSDEYPIHLPDGYVSVATYTDGKERH